MRNVSRETLCISNVSAKFVKLFPSNISHQVYSPSSHPVQYCQSVQQTLHRLADLVSTPCFLI